VVTIGDSYISGQGARWAGNTRRAERNVDALGSDAYFDAPSGGQRRPGCRRGDQSVAGLHIGSWRGENLACAGATTASLAGQVQSLRRFAASHDVSAVVMLIGGNDFDFGSVVSQCVDAFLRTVQSQPRHCSDDPATTSQFSADRVKAVGNAVGASLRGVAAAMKRAGLAAGSYRLVVLTYPSPLPPASELRYPQTLPARYTVGGCPFFDADATWAATEALGAINSAVRVGVHRSGVAGAEVLDMGSAFVGHRLCERGAGLLEETGLSSWREPGAATQLEWVNNLSLGRLSEAVHPNYWGMLAQRACVRLALRRGVARSLRCIPAAGSQSPVPRMTLR
jgi:hypothetical protein